MKNIKNEKGSLALFVTIAVLFFMAFLLTMYLATANEQKTQLAITARVKEVYEKNLEDKVLETIYEGMIGTDENIPIYTAEQLKKIGTGESVYISEVGKYYTFNLNSNYILKNNIELNKGKYSISNDGTITFSSDAQQWIPIGTESSPFNGNFNGNNYKISGLYINNTTLSNQGLFGVNSGKLENIVIDNGYMNANQIVGGIVGINLENSTINNCVNNNRIIGNGQVGGICGKARGTIENCINNGAIGESNNKYNLGGIYGFNDDSTTTVKNCSNNGKVIGNQAGGIGGSASNTVIDSCSNNGEMIGVEYIGGIIGFTWKDVTAQIINCYNTKKVSGNRYVGGILGQDIQSLPTRIEKCYNTGKVEANSYLGGIVGNLKNGDISNCYYLTNTATGAVNGADIEGKAQVRDITFMQSSDFITLLNNGENNWKIVTGKNDNYPILSWQN